VARSIFDSVAAAPSLAPAPGAAAAAAAAAAPSASAAALLAADADEIGEEWGADDDLDLTGEGRAARYAGRL